MHSGHERSFVYDIADLYKANTSIPAAFDVVAEDGGDIGARSRRAVRDLIFEKKLMQQAVFDVKTLLKAEDLTEDELVTNVVSLWDIREGSLEAGQNYAGA